MKLRGIGRLKVGLAVLTVSAVMAQPSWSETLADALVGAYNHSGLLEQNRALLRAADEDVASASASLLPIINWTADVSRTFGDSASASTGFASRDIGNTEASVGLTAQLQLYDSGADRARIEAEKENVLATRAGLTSVEQQILLRAVRAFMNVIRAVENVALRENNVRLLTEELRAAQDRFDVGEVTRTDVALAESALAEARSGLAAAQGDLLQAQEEYRNAVGRRPGSLTAPRALPRAPSDLAGNKSLAYRSSPDLAQAQRLVSAAELNIIAAEADMNPVVTLDGSLTAREDLDDEGFTRSGSVGIGVSGPIYRGGSLSSVARRAIANRDAQRSNLHQVRHNVEQAVGNAYADLLASRAQLEASERQIRAARIAFQGVREEATLGARTTLDVLDAEQELLDAQANRIAAQADLYISAYELLEATGQLTAERLGLPVQTYDPAAYYNLVKDGVAKRSRQGQQLDRVLKSLQKN
ncbi:MAG: TolC family outer membrane protein [Pseudomonadota bacterium]